jgi:hypothetical protein
MSKYLADLFAQKMDRKEFLVRVGATLLALVGITGLLKSLSTLSHPADGTTQARPTSYGGGDHVEGQS